MSMLSRFAALGGGVITDPYWANVIYLLVGNGANGTTTNIIDSSNLNATLTRYGSPVISTAQSKFGSGSLYVNGSSYVSGPTIPSYALPGDFTVEAWVYINVYQPGPLLAIGTYDNGVWLRSQQGTECCINATFFSLPASYDSIFPLNTWLHIAITRSGTTGRLFVQGILKSSITVSGTVNTTGKPVVIGVSPHGPTEYTNDYTYDFRVTKGVARYTANFTPPTAAFPTS